MIKRKYLMGAILALVLLLPMALMAREASAQLLTAHRFYGAVTLDSANAADGTAVVASANCATATATATAAVSGGEYDLTLEESSSSGSCGGSTVTFTIGGAAATESAAYSGFSVTSLALSAVTTPAAPAAVTLTPSSGAGLATISGSDFAKSSAVTVTWGGAAPGMTPTSVTSDSAGGFTAILNSPVSDNGEYTVTATDAAGNSASATYTLAVSAGPQGLQGETGAAGVEGAAGAAGVDGAAGGAGAAGVQGPQGPRGLIGFEGDQGDPGPAGVAGSQGARGSGGEAGASGVAGATGASGAAGATGPAGAQGVQGSVGADASAAIVWVALIVAIVAAVFSLVSVAVLRRR